MISSYNKDGKMLIEAILMANSFEKIAKHLTDIVCSVLFVDYQLIEFVQNAFITRTSLMQLCSSQQMTYFITTDLYLKLLIESPTKDMEFLFKHSNKWRLKEPVLHYGLNTYDRTSALHDLI